MESSMTVRIESELREAGYRKRRLGRSVAVLSVRLGVSLRCANSVELS